MNIVVDVGNSSAKLAVFSKFRLIKKQSCSVVEFPTALLDLLDRYKKVSHILLASVGHFSITDLKQIPDHIEIIELDHSLKLPFTNLYKTPKTLGVDRLALVAAAAEFYSTSNVLVIDAGSCITYDFINSNNEYLGGSISPGIRLRYESLHNLTANLPLLDLKSPKKLIGNTTETSIHSGVVNGAAMEIDGIIEAYQSNWADLTVILTGGDAKILSKRLKNSIFANPNFLLEGLNLILEFNKKA